MTFRRFAIVAALTVILAGSSMVGAQCIPGWTNGVGTMAVNAAAALEGNCGLEVIFDGTTTKRFVEDQSPTAESVYRISFLINPNTMSLDGASAVQNQHAIVDSTATTAQGDKIGFRVVLQDKKKTGNLQLKVKAGVYLSGNPSKVTRKTSPVVLQATADPPGTFLVEVEWQAATALDVRDGIIRIRVDGGAWSSNTLETFGFGIETTKFGAINGIDADTSGSMYLDDFQSFRTLLP